MQAGAGENLVNGSEKAALAEMLEYLAEGDVFAILSGR